MNYLLRSISFLILFNFISYIGQAQDNTCTSILHGIITDQSNHELAGATVYVIEAEKGSVVGDDGHFDIKDLCNGLYTVRVQHLGHETIDKKVLINSYTEIVLRLHSKETELSEVVISQKKYNEERTQATSTLSGAALDATRGLSLGEALKNITGVTSLQTGPSISKPIIHGLHSNRVLILNNGIRQEGQQWGSEHAPEIDPFIANKITVVKGASGVRYGADAIGGVILVEPKELPSEYGSYKEINTVFLSNGLQGVGSAMAEGRSKALKGLSWRVHTTYKRAGNTKAPLYYIDNTGFREWNYSAALGYKKDQLNFEAYYSRFDSKLGIFRGAHFGNMEDLKRAISLNSHPADSGFTYTIDRPYQKVDHHLLKLSMQHFTKEKGTFQYIYGLQYNDRGEYDLHGAKNKAKSASGKPEVAFKQYTHTIEAIWEHPTASNIKGTVGISGIYQDNISNLSVAILVPDYRSFTGGIFALEKWSLGNWEIEGGARYDFRFMEASLFTNTKRNSSYYNFRNASVTTGAIYTVNDALQLRLNASTAWRPPSPNEMFSRGVHHGAARYELGRETLTSERAYKTIATVAYSTTMFNAELSAYNNSFDNFIYLSPTDSTILTTRGAFPLSVYKQVDAVLRGIDFSSTYQFNKSVSASGKASLLWARNRSTKTYLDLMPSNRLEGNIGYLFPLKGTLQNTTFSLGGLYVMRQNRVPAGMEIAPPPMAYFLMHAEMGTSISLGKNTIATLSITANNLLNTQYRDYLNAFRFFTDEAGRNIIIRLKVPFN